MSKTISVRGSHRARPHARTIRRWTPANVGVRKTKLGDYVLMDLNTGATLTYGYFTTRDEAVAAAAKVAGVKIPVVE